MRTKQTYSDIEAADFLGIKGTNQQKATAVINRLVFLGYTETCSRCEGSGNYSSCQRFGTTCFKCMGRTTQVQKFTHALLTEAKARIEAGELIPYFERNARIKQAKNAEKIAGEIHSAAQVCKDYTERYDANRKVNRYISDEEYTVFFASPLSVYQTKINAALREVTELVCDLQFGTLQPEQADAKAQQILATVERMKEIDAEYVALKQVAA